MNINNCWYKNKCTNECKESCIRYNSMKALFSLSQLPESMWEHKELYANKEGDYKAFVRLKEIQDNILDFINNGNNLYIYSNHCGNGKTSFSVRLLQSYFDKIWHNAGFNCKALFINVPGFLYKLKQSMSREVEGFEELLQNIEKVDLVIWDDLPCQKFTGYEHQVMLQYIDSRINAKKSNIYTGNADKDMCIELMGDRITSRVFGTSEFIEFIEGDKRCK